MLAGKQMNSSDVHPDTHAAADRDQRSAGPSELEQATRLREAIGRLSRRLRPTLAAEGMTPTQISVLATVVRQGPIGLSDLAEREGLNPTMLSRVVAVLGDLGLVRRESDREDRRAGVLVATDAGVRRRAEIRRERAEVLSVHLAELPAAEREALARALPALEALAERLQGRRA
jgi:DNA-binding MarR family transcriptional regulator